MGQNLQVNYKRVWKIVRHFSWLLKMMKKALTHVYVPTRERCDVFLFVLVIPFH